MKTASIDEFISGYPHEVQDILQQIRQIIQTAAPEAKEKISYGIPTFILNGKNMIHFSAYDKHIGLYPGAQAVADFADELTEYETSKGTIRFPLNNPIPYDLIDKITRHCVTQSSRKKQRKDLP